MRTNQTSRNGLGAAVAREVVIVAAPGLVLRGDLVAPSRGGSLGVALVVHASRSTRREQRNRVVLAALHRAGLATLLLDVFTQHEKVGQPPADAVELLAERIVSATDWLHHQPETESLPLGYLAVGAGSAAALLAAAMHPAEVDAVVLWGGASELSRAPLERVLAPVLLIADAGTDDLAQVQQLRRRLTCPTDFAVVPGSMHAFAHFGPVQRCARLAADWLARAAMPAARSAP